MDGEAASRPSARSDLISGGIWVVIGIAIALGSWQMDRLESQGVPWFTAPGLLPGIVGVSIVLTALIIVVRAWRAGGRTAETVGAPPNSGGALLSLGLCLAFAGALVGRGTPFVVAAAIYLFFHIFLLQLPERRARGEILRGAMVAATIAVIAAAAISLTFQEIFLVRLP